MLNYINYNPDDIGLAANPEPEEPVWVEEEEDDIVAICDNCDEPIRDGDNALGIVRKTAEGKYKPVCLCSACTRDISLGDLLDLLDIYNIDGDALRTLNTTRKYAADMNDYVKNQWRSTITTAAKMVKGARA